MPARQGEEGRDIRAGALERYVDHREFFASGKVLQFLVQLTLTGSVPVSWGLLILASDLESYGHSTWALAVSKFSIFDHDWNALT